MQAHRHGREPDEMAVSLLLPMVLAAVLFHPDAAVEGHKAAVEGPYRRCPGCDIIRREVAKREQQALSPANKVLCAALFCPARLSSGLIGA